MIGQVDKGVGGVICVQRNHVLLFFRVWLHKNVVHGNSLIDTSVATAGKM